MAQIQQYVFRLPVDGLEDLLLKRRDNGSIQSTHQGHDNFDALLSM